MKIFKKIKNSTPQVPAKNVGAKNTLFYHKIDFGKYFFQEFVELGNSKATTWKQVAKIHYSKPKNKGKKA